MNELFGIDLNDVPEKAIDGMKYGIGILAVFLLVAWLFSLVGKDDLI